MAIEIPTLTQNLNQRNLEQLDLLLRAFPSDVRRGIERLFSCMGDWQAPAIDCPVRTGERSNLKRLIKPSKGDRNELECEDDVDVLIDHTGKDSKRERLRFSLGTMNDRPSIYLLEGGYPNMSLAGGFIFPSGFNPSKVDRIRMDELRELIERDIVKKARGVIAALERFSRQDDRG